MKTPHPDPWWRSQLEAGRRICAQDYIGSGGFAALGAFVVAISSNAVVLVLGLTFGALAVTWLVATIGFHRSLLRLERESMKLHKERDALDEALRKYCR